MRPMPAWPGASPLGVLLLSAGIVAVLGLQRVATGSAWSGAFASPLRVATEPTPRSRGAGAALADDAGAASSPRSRSRSSRSAACRRPTSVRAEIMTRAELAEVLPQLFEEQYPPEERERDNGPACPRPARARPGHRGAAAPAARARCSGLLRLRAADGGRRPTPGSRPRRRSPMPTSTPTRCRTRPSASSRSSPIARR